MAFPLDTPYYPIPGSQPEGTFGVMMEILLKTRLKLNLETNRRLYDEDVNAYLAGLLVSYIDPEYLKAISEVLSQYDFDVYQQVTKADTRVQAYWIYKVNADDLLLSVGIFHPLRKEAKSQTARMKRYYSTASGYQRRIYGRSTAVGEIQTKLAFGTERYLSILSGVRADYLNFIERLKPEELTALQERLKEWEGALPLKSKQDQFLDAYSAWLKGSRDPALRQQLLQLIEELKALDPHFKPEPFLSQLLTPNR